jgi:2-polyprenyl-3-methyl-5-hydroxy-6-metoxy-1,4-benzoquinol methylase
MTALDRLLQTWRIRKARHWLGAGDRVLDVGCADGSLFRHLPDLTGVGVDTDSVPRSTRRVRYVQGRFPEAIAAEPPFDRITALAVMEHIPEAQMQPFVAGLWSMLRPGGRAILTIPSPLVDTILHVLVRLRLLEGMAAHEHWGFKPSHTVPMFEAEGFRTVHARRFQLGLNHCFVFEKPAA